MGNVSSIYIQYQAAGDQHVGRTVCGLNPADTTFATLPPTFRPDYNPVPLLTTLFSNYWRVSAELRKVVTMTTASVLYNEEWIRTQLPPDHPFFSTALYTTDFHIPFSEMVECHTWKPGDVMKATGIPPHVSLLLNMSELLKRMNTLPDQIRQTLNQNLQQHQPFFRSASSDQVKAIMVEAFREVMAKNRGDDDGNAAGAAPVAAPVHYPPLFLTKKNKLSRLPPDFKLPRGPLPHAWARYFCWDTKNHLPPLRSVKGCELDRKYAGRLSKYSKLMEAIVNEAKKQGVWAEPDENDRNSAMAILQRIDLSKLVPGTTKSKRERRLCQLSWTTLARDLYKRDYHRKQHHAENRDNSGSDMSDGVGDY